MGRILFLLVATVGLLSAQSGTLDIYWVDTEGGAATLVVTPAGESMLVDSGNPRGRDAQRIQDVATKQAGLSKIDYLVTTHYHIDHVGGLSDLAGLIPIEHFIDHGDSVEAAGNPRAARTFATYQSISEGKRTILKPGDKIPLEGLDVTVVAAAYNVLDKPINGGGPNPYCEGAANKDPDPTQMENTASLGFLLTFGDFTFLDTGDLTWDIEMKLACPVNLVGEVTLMQATHHGFYHGYSGNPAHISAVKPQVVIVNNGPRKDRVGCQDDLPSPCARGVN